TETVGRWPRICASMPVAPRLLQGPLPRKSPENRRFRNPRYRGQLIGCCVGENITAMIETLLRMPAGRAPDGQPLPPTDLSPLLTYYLARKHGGMPGGDEGAILSDAIKALAVESQGVCAWDLWPATDDGYLAYSDRHPVQAALEECHEHTVKQYAILTDWQH